MTSKNKFSLFFSLYLLLSAFSASAQVYFDRLNASEPSAEKLQESLKKIKEHRDVEEVEINIPPFHKRMPQADHLKYSFCTQCHQSPPHSKNVRSRAFLNMHTRYLACETCHFRPEDLKFQYQWYDFKNQQVVEGQDDFFRLQKKLSDPDQANSIETKNQNSFIKIIPTLNDQPVLMHKSHPFVSKIKQIWEQGTQNEKVALRAKIHLPLEKKGPKCDSCHRQKDSLLDFSKLGAPDTSVQQLQQNILAEFFKRYRQDDERIRIDRLIR